MNEVGAFGDARSPASRTPASLKGPLGGGAGQGRHRISGVSYAGLIEGTKTVPLATTTRQSLRRLGRRPQ